MFAFEWKACLTYQPDLSAPIVSYSEEVAAEVTYLIKILATCCLKGL